MIIAWWDKEHPDVICIIDEDILPWKTANWVVYRKATKEELDMYKKGITIYSTRGLK